MLIVNTIACSIIVMWAVWSALSGKVRDGIVGKFIFGVIAVSALASALGHGMQPSQTSGSMAAIMTLEVAFAAYATRLVFMKYAWPRIANSRCFCKLTGGSYTRRHDDL